MDKVITHAAPVTKLRAMRRTLLADEVMEELRVCPDLRSFFLVLRENELYRDLPDMPDLETFESWQSCRMYESIQRLSLFYDLHYRELFTVLMMRQEVEQIKMAVRGLYNPQDLSLRSRCSVSGRLDAQRLLQADSLEEIRSAIHYAPYQKLFDYLDTGRSESLFELEMHLDQLYFSELSASFVHLSAMDRKIMKEVVGLNADLYNLSWLLRAKHIPSMTPQLMFNYALPGGERVDTARLLELSDMSAPQLKEWIRRTPYAPAFEGRALSRSARMEAWILRRMRKIASERPVSIAPMILFIHEWEYQQKDLDTMAEAKQSGRRIDDLLIGKLVKHGH